MKNDQIRAYLINRRNSYQAEFESIVSREALFEAIYAELEAFDFQVYASQVEKQIQRNLREWWVNPKKGIRKEEGLFAILFEYDYFYAKGVEAQAYGIGEWEDYQVQTEEFDMGWEYDFTTEFYALPGISMNFFDPLEKLDHPNLPEQYREGGIHNVTGFYELVQLFKFNGMIAIHEVLRKMDSNEEFEAVNYKDNFMFIIDEHDSGEVFPLLVKAKR